jgi:putative selenate reductase
MKVQPFDALLHWILRELDANDSIFGIHRSLFYSPRTDAPYASELFGHYLATPIGPAAGPHTQLAQNIVASWLSGGRFIELKTVQIMDELEIPRPCIDMEDEGYNVEWSQELRLDESAWEYIKAWVLIHILRRLLGWDDSPLGTLFNMSVGYNLEGILRPPMQRFMARLEDASAEIAQLRELLQARFPQYADLPIPSKITNSVTLSTMHGCPPDEIEAISRYLLQDRGLHTFVKLNPTLLGKETVMRILHDHLGYREIQIPDSVFEHDLKYDRAVTMLKALKELAGARGVTLGVKLSNTLAVANHRGALPGGEMYLSGRALYPITMNLFHKLAQEFGGDIPVSYAGGADAQNASTILAAGALPVTAASDLLKPGGYTRSLQWLENIETEMRLRGVANLDELTRNKMASLAAAAADALENRRWKKSAFPFGLPKIDSGLGLFDCVAAPCTYQCAVCQDVPEYACLIARGEYDRALDVILHRNPLPGITGHVCTHLCQTRCTRNNYDQPVQIRALKRFAAEHGESQSGKSETGRARPVAHTAADRPDSRVAIIGSGPAGLSAAYFLALNGVRPIIFEAREIAGGMCAVAPHFRLPPAVVQADIRRITDMGAQLILNQRVLESPDELLRKGFDAVFMGIGFQKDAGLDIEGIEGDGVFTAIRFLESVGRGAKPDLGTRVLVIGGGNTAMDAARTAQRLTGRPVTVVYRRTQAEMPAEPEELRDLFAEGNHLAELSSPERVIREKGLVVALECVRNQLGEPAADGRRSPVRVPGSEFRIPADAIILAIGQQPDIAFIDGSRLSIRRDGSVVTDEITRQTDVENVYAGGDVTRGPAIIIQACEDGRRAAEAICRGLGIRFEWPPLQMPELSETDILQVKRERARLAPTREPVLLPVAQRTGFESVELTLSEDAARAEAARCVQCSAVCDKCVEVCPNRANYTYLIEPLSWTLPVFACPDGELVVVGKEVLEIAQERQILHVDDFCNQCGNCATFCVHQGRPYVDKPCLFLLEADFLKEADNPSFHHGGLYHVMHDTIRRRKDGQESSLTVHDGWFDYQDGQVRATLSVGGDIKDLTLKKSFDARISLQSAAEMWAVYQGIARSLPWLLSD